MNRLFPLAAGAFCLALASSAAGRSWVVAQDGTGDFTLLSAAYDSAASGDTILVRPGHYQEEEYDECDEQPLRITEKSLTTLGTGGTPAEVTISMRLAFGYGHETTVENVSFENTCQPLTLYDTSVKIRNCGFLNNVHTCSAAALSVASENALIENCRFLRNDVCGALRVHGNGITVRSCLFDGNQDRQEGGGIYALGDLVIEGCVFLNNTAPQGAAIYSASAEIRGCSFWRNDGASTVYLDGESDNLHNCIITGTIGGSGVRCGPFHWHGEPWCNDFWANDGGMGNCGSGGSGNFSLDPLFCDPEGGDLSLREGSPCLDGGSGGYPCGLIGAYGVGCGESPVRTMSWGRLKAVYR